MSTCLFCAIAAGTIPADIVARSDRALAFRDIAPAAPQHVLVIPIDHHSTMAELTSADPALAAQVLALAADVARQLDLADGYRVVVNTGEHAGQTVHHVHAHVLGGRAMTWPPG